MRFLVSTFLAIVRLIRAGKILAFMSVLVAFLSLALLDSTKARIYASLVVPALCFGLAAAVAPATAARRGIATALRTVAVWLLLIWVMVDGLAGYRFVDNRGSCCVSLYSSVAQRIATSLESSDHGPRIAALVVAVTHLSVPVTQRCVGNLEVEAPTSRTPPQ